jgi:hypothetical protein
MWLVALIPEIFDALAGFIAAGGWWQLPLFIGLFKVEETLTHPVPQAPAPQSPVQQAAAGAGAAVGGAGQAVGTVGQFFSQNAPWLIVGGVALLILGRR